MATEAEADPRTATLAVAQEGRSQRLTALPGGCLGLLLLSQRLVAVEGAAGEGAGTAVVERDLEGEGRGLGLGLGLGLALLRLPDQGAAASAVGRRRLLVP